MGRERSSRSQNILQAPPLVWIGVLVTLAAGAALIAATVLANRSESTSRTAEAFRGRLELLRIERDLFIATDRLDTVALLELVDGPVDGRLTAAEEQFEDALGVAEMVLDRFISERRHGRQGAASIRTALASFRDGGLSLGTPVDDLRAVDRIYQALGWTAVPSPEGPWFDLCDYIYNIQISASYPLETAAEYIARYWEAERPATAPTSEPLLEARAAYLRSLDHVTGDGTDTKWSLEQLLERERALRYGPEIAALVEDILAADGAHTMKSIEPFLLGRTEEVDIKPLELYEQMEIYTEQVRRQADRALVLADRQIAEAADQAAMRALLARAGALASILLLAGVLATLELRRRRFNRYLHRLAETDSLTGLGNRHALQVYEAPRLADPELGGFALIHLDLDNFKAINDSFGHQIGDQALAAFAGVCRDAIPDGCSVARIGGDEFVMVLHSLDEPVLRAREVARRVHQTLESPVDCGGRPLRLQASIGIATSDGPAQLDEMMVEADLALYAAKERGSNRREIFADLLRRTLIKELPSVLAEQALDCAFQPQVHLSTGEVLGVEALARWPGRSNRDVPARKMVDAIEWLGETAALLRSLLRRVEEAYAETGHLFDGRYWLNLSPADLAVSGAAENLLEMLTSTSVPLDRLGFEVTENLPIVDFDLAVEVLTRLRDSGVAVAIDDFGSGKTPLKHLTTLPIDLVKLDRSVTVGVDSDNSNRVLAHAVRFICESHGMDVLAEGVETDREIAVLRELGIDRAQGYVFARPMQLQPLTAYLIERGRPQQAEVMVGAGRSRSTG